MEDSDDKFSEPVLFAYMKPFDTWLWLLILGSTTVVSVGVCILGRLSTYGWYQNPPDDFPLWEARFQITPYNSVWQSLSAILQQGKLKNCFNFTAYMHT